jgi:hypothetical protein
MVAAITDSLESPEADTIQMLPGSYCPIDLEGTFAQPIKFIGVGIAGIDTSGGPVSFTGPEAGLTTINDDSVHCVGTSELIEVNARVTSTAPMVFQNMTVDGSEGGSFGFDQRGVSTNTVLRDFIAQHLVTGIYFQSGSVGCCQSTTLDLENSAALNNQLGVDLEGVVASVDDTTIAGNTNVGLNLINFFVSLAGDTISHNHIGVSAFNFGNAMQLVDTVVAGNTEDCGSANDWELGNGFEPGSFGNLVGSFSCPINQGTSHTDIRDTTLTDANVPAVGLNGGPTPSALPPSSAQGIDEPSCGLNGVDQREFIAPSASTCDAGSVQSGGSGSGSAATGDLDLGTVTVGSTSSGTVSVSVSGGGLIGVSGVSISGTGWRITSDGCTYMIMESSFFAPIRGCSVGVSVHPTGIGTWNGTLTVHTTAGDVTAQLHSGVFLPPVIAGFTPLSGPAGATVTINGSHFDGTTAVAFGGEAAQSFTVVSDSQINAVVAVGTATGFVTVTGPSGTVTSTHPFVVVASRPLIYTLSPGQGSTGSTVTILGQNLSGASAVTFGGVPAVTFSSSPGSVTVTVPAAALTGHIAVTTAGGTVTSTAVFTVIPAIAPPPTIATFSPSGGTHGVQVRIMGTGFTGATSVKFNGVAASFTVLSDSSIRAIVPLHATTGHITVTTAGGTATSASNFTTV